MTWLHWVYAMRTLFLDYLPGICVGVVCGFLAGMAFGAKMERRNRPRLMGRFTHNGWYPE